MKQYYLGGYYLVKLLDNSLADHKSRKYTCSSCINDLLFDDWSFSWANNSLSRRMAIKEFNIGEAIIEKVWEWTDRKFDEQQIGWCNVFADLKSAVEYKSNFFSHLSGVEVLSIYFDENEKCSLIDEFSPEAESVGTIGLVNNLRQKVSEKFSEDEMSLGFDLIGVEWGGSFHSFHCHDLASDLISKFGVRLNQWGLLDDYENWAPVVDYMNDEKNGFEPVPWFVVKVKRVVTSS